MIKREELTNPASCMSRARDDEMTFVLLGRDVAAPVAILAWIQERIRLGKNKPDDAQIVEAADCAKSMELSILPNFCAVRGCGLKEDHEGDCMPLKNTDPPLESRRRIRYAPGKVRPVEAQTEWISCPK